MQLLVSEQSERSTDRDRHTHTQTHTHTDTPARRNDPAIRMSSISGFQRSAGCHTNTDKRTHRHTSTTYTHIYMHTQTQKQTRKDAVNHGAERRTFKLVAHINTIRHVHCTKLKRFWSFNVIKFRIFIHPRLRNMNHKCTQMYRHAHTSTHINTHAHMHTQTKTARLTLRLMVSPKCKP